MDGSIKRVVVVRPDEKLGETLLATPVFHALKQLFQESHIEAWVTPQWAGVINGSPCLDAVRGVPYRPHGRAFWRLFFALRALRPHAVLILRPDTRRHALIAYLARVPVRAGAVQRRPAIARFLTHVAHFEPSMHQVERNLAVAETWLGRQLPRYPLHFSPAQPGSLPAELKNVPTGRYAVLHLSTGGVQPRWLPERFAAVGTFLYQKYGLLPVLSGAADVRLMGEQCFQATHGVALNLVGRLSILDLAEVLRHARLLVSVDTGVVHLAAAVGTPCVSLHFRRDYPPHQWHAWQVPNAVVVPLQYCAGCTPLQCQPYPKECVTSIHPEQVIEAIERLLSTL